MITFHLSCRQEEKFVQKIAGSGSASTAGGNSQWNSHLWISPPRRASNLPIQYRKTGATARLTATGNRFPAKINRSTAISNRSTVTLNRSTVTLDRSTVTLNRSTVTSNRSTATLNRSTATLNRFPASRNCYPVAENAFTAGRDGSIGYLAAGAEVSKNKEKYEEFRSYTEPVGEFGYMSLMKHRPKEEKKVQRYFFPIVRRNAVFDMLCEWRQICFIG